MQVATGSYTGNGADNRGITGVGFQPDFVIVRTAASGNASVMRTSTMTGDLTAVNGAALTANLVQSLDSDGFTVGTDTRVNANLATFYWLAVKDTGGGDFKVGTYTGNATDNRTVTGLGFQPAIVIVLNDTTENWAERTAEYSGDLSQFILVAGAPAANVVQSLDADGFTVGTHGSVNTNTIAYHWIAFKAVAGFVATGTYTGDGTDNRSITGVGFSPAWVSIHRAATSAARFKLSGMGTTAVEYGAATAANDIIQAMEADGFQLGTAATVNAGSGETTFRFFALKEGSTSTVATLTLGQANGQSTTSLTMTNRGDMTLATAAGQSVATAQLNDPGTMTPAVASCVCTTSAVLAAAVELGIFGECFCETSLTLVVPQANETMGKPQRGVGRRG